MRSSRSSPGALYDAVDIREYILKPQRTTVDNNIIGRLIAICATSKEHEPNSARSGRGRAMMQNPGTTRRERFDHMKAAYSARSSIVHGDRPKGLRTQQELDSFTDRTSRELRYALRAMIDLAQSEPTRKRLVDWDEAIVGPTNASVV